jgi:hypothetical protein
MSFVPGGTIVALTAQRGNLKGFHIFRQFSALRCIVAPGHPWLAACNEGTGKSP